MPENIEDLIRQAVGAGEARKPIPMGGKPVDISQMRREVEENARRVAQVKQELAPRPEVKPAYEPALKFLPSGMPESIKYAMGRAARNIGPSMTAGEFGVDVKPGGFVDLAETAGEVLDLPSQIVGEEVFTRTGSPEAAIAAMYGPGMTNPASLVKGAASVARKASQAGKRMAGELATKPQKVEAPYATAQEGPFYRVRPRGYEESGYLPFGTREAVGTTGAAFGRSAGNVVSKFIPDEQVDELISQPDNFVRQSADQYAQEKFGRPYELPEIPESSLLKQGPIGRVFELAATDNPQYKDAVFGAYLREMPEVVEQSGAKSYDELMARSYEQLAKETEEQFKRLPLNLSYHRAGEGNYDSSRELLKDVYGNKHMYVYQGGDPHDFLNKVDPDTGLNTNEMFRAVHDFYGHAVHGNQFGPKGEEIAWGAHSQMFSPLARLAMSSETRGQNSFVNYTPINAELKAKVANIEARLRDAKKIGDKDMIDNLNALKKDAFSTFQFAPQKSVLLPPEFLKLDYNGGMPDYLQTMIKPAPETATSMPLTHFSFDPNLSATDPSKFGEGAAGREVARLKGAKGAVGDRTYFYPGEPGAIERETQVGPYRYRTEASSLYDVSKDPMNLGVLARESNRSPFASNVNPGMVYQGEAMTDLERLAKEYGYEGIFNPNANPPMAMTYKSMPVQRHKKGGRVSMDAMRLAVGGMSSGGRSGLIRGGIESVSKALKNAEKAKQYTSVDRGRAGFEAAEMIKRQEQLRASEALGQAREKGIKKIGLTQADRTRVGGGNIGGPNFPALSQVDPEYAGKVWGVGDEGTASRLINQSSPDFAWTTLLGSEHQLKSNPVVFDKLKRAWQKSVKEGNLSPELEAKINQNLALEFGEGASIRDPKIWKMAEDSFAKRGFLGDLMMGQGVAPKKGGVALGGEKSGKGVIFKPSDILIRETEPSLLHPKHGGDVPTFAVGPRLFTLGDETHYRPDLHPGFPTLIEGEDLGYNIKPVPHEIALPDWNKNVLEKKGRKPGYYDLTLGLEGEGLPSQELSDEYIRHLLREGFKKGGIVKRKKKGGVVKKAEGGQITSDDLIIEERKL